MLKYKAIAAAVLLAVPAWAAPAAVAGSQFDGAWSVSIITNAGTCDRGYRYAVRIQDGRISYEDQAVDVSGEVDPRGDVHVVVKSGNQQAIGTGRMSHDYGEGSWSGESSAGQCSGVWQAEREANSG